MYRLNMHSSFVCQSYVNKNCIEIAFVENLYLGYNVMLSLVEFSSVLRVVILRVSKFKWYRCGEGLCLHFPRDQWYNHTCLHWVRGQFLGHLRSVTSWVTNFITAKTYFHVFQLWGASSLWPGWHFSWPFPVPSPSLSFPTPLSLTHTHTHTALVQKRWHDLTDASPVAANQ